MSRNRDPRNPFDAFFGGGNNNDGNDPFGDPFFRHFADIQRHMDSVFQDFFEDQYHFPSEESRNHANNVPQQQQQQQSSSHNNGPNLSAINPSAPVFESTVSGSGSDSPSSTPEPREENPIRIIMDHHQRPSHENSGSPNVGGLRALLQHFFEPEYDTYTLADVNPSIPNSSHGPITNEDTPGLIVRDGNPPGFRSPYLPGYHGAQKSMEFGDSHNNNHMNMQAFSRSQSIMISTGADGKTTKTTTITDENGQRHTTTEVMDGSESPFHAFGDLNDNEFPGFNGILDAFFGRHEPGRGGRNTGHGRGSSMFDDNNSDPNGFPIAIHQPEKPQTPMNRIRNFWQQWKPTFYQKPDPHQVHQQPPPPQHPRRPWFGFGSYNDGRHNSGQGQQGRGGEWFWGKSNESRSSSTSPPIPSSSDSSNINNRPADTSLIKWRSMKDFYDARKDNELRDGNNIVCKNPPDNDREPK